MDTYIKRFLSHNKYPKIMTNIDTLMNEYDNLPYTEINIDANATLILTLQNLGIGAVENLDKAEHCANQMNPDILQLNLLVIVYLRKT